MHDTDSKIKVHDFDKELLGYHLNLIKDNKPNLKEALITKDKEPYLAPILELFKLHARGVYKLDVVENNETKTIDSIMPRRGSVNPNGTFNIGLQDCMVGKTTIVMNFSNNKVFSIDSDNQGSTHLPIDVLSTLEANANMNSLTLPQHGGGGYGGSSYEEIINRFTNKIVIFEIYHIPNLNEESSLSRYLYGSDRVTIPNVSDHLKQAYEFIKKKEESSYGNYRNPNNEHTHVRIVFSSIIDFDEIDRLDDDQYLYLKSHEILLGTKGLSDNIDNPAKLIRDITHEEINFLLSRGTNCLYICDPDVSLPPKYVNIAGKALKIPVFAKQGKESNAELVFMSSDKTITRWPAEDIANLDFVFNSREEANDNLKKVDKLKTDTEIYRLEAELREIKSQEEKAKVDYKRKIKELKEENKNILAKAEREKASHELDMSAKFNKHNIDLEHLYKKNTLEHRSKDRDEVIETLKIGAAIIGVIGTSLIVYNKLIK